MFARWPGPDSRKETDGWSIRCNDVRTSSVAQPVNAVQSSSDETQIPIAEPINTDLKPRLRRAFEGEAGSRRAGEGSGDLLGATQEGLAGVADDLTDGVEQQEA